VGHWIHFVYTILLGEVFLGGKHTQHGPPMWIWIWTQIYEHIELQIHIYGYNMGGSILTIYMEICS
jgi:hypothetical protein